MRYHKQDLELELSDLKDDQGTQRFKVRVLDSPGGQQIREDEAELPADLRQQLRLLEQRDLTLQEMIELGIVLGDGLFPPGARDLLRDSQTLLAEDEGLRVQLRVRSRALADVPWEYAYIADPDTPPDQRDASGFLVLNRRFSLVRYELMGQPATALDPVGQGPLRMVVLLANPHVPGRKPLNLKRELEIIKEALKPLKGLKGVPEIKLVAYEDVTVDTVTEALVSEPHIFHFAGHGEFEGDMGPTYGSRVGKGHLLLGAEGQQAEKFPAYKLAVNLRGANVRLAVMGACEAGRRDQVNAWTGVVPALTRAGIPAVLGNQYSIDDANAIAFSKSLYSALAAGQPIDWAVTHGRLAILNRGAEDERDWGVPVLYLRVDAAEDGVLFAKTADVTEPPVVIRREELRDAQVDKSALRKAITEHFGIEFLEVLCSDVQQDLADAGIDLEVSLETVGGTSKVAKVLNLITYLENRGHLEYLVRAVRRERPGII